VLIAAHEPRELRGGRRGEGDIFAHYLQQCPGGEGGGVSGGADGEGRGSGAERRGRERRAYREGAEVGTKGVEGGAARKEAQSGWRKRSGEALSGVRERRAYYPPP
jgi:hypothetical protein